MLGLRQVFRSSLRLLPWKSIERTSAIRENPSRTLVQTLESEGFFKKFSTQVNEKSQEIASEEKPLTKQPVAQVVTKMKIMFTCKKCNTRNSKMMSKVAYEKGVVIIRCDGCKNNHLIADNLGWFGADQRKRNIEKIMKDKGETVKRLQVYGSDVFEVVNKDEKIEIKTEQSIEVEAKRPDDDR